MSSYMCIKCDDKLDIKEFSGRECEAYIETSNGVDNSFLVVVFYSYDKEVKFVHQKMFTPKQYSENEHIKYLNSIVSKYNFKLKSIKGFI